MFYYPSLSLADLQSQFKQRLASIDPFHEPCALTCIGALDGTRSNEE
nr:hypothetical protein [uncultured bacterium]